MNFKNRIFKSKNYIEFIHKLPCAVTGKNGEGIQAHHVAPKGMGGILNDYFAIPLWHDIHINNSGHITTDKLQSLIDEPVHEIVIFHLSLYVEHLIDKYDPEIDIETGFYEYKRLRGII